MNEIKIATLREEIDFQFANVLHWRQGTGQTCGAGEKYQRRQRRLREIRAAQRALDCEGDNCASLRVDPRSPGGGLRLTDSGPRWCKP